LRPRPPRRTARHRQLVTVEQRQRIVLREPPRHRFIQQHLQAVGRHQAAGELAAAKQRQVVIDHAVGRGRGAVRHAVAAAPDRARHFAGQQGGWRQAGSRQVAAVDGLLHALGIAPDHAHQFGAIGEHLPEARRQLGRRQRRDDEIGAQCGQRFFAARQLEAQRLFDPQRIGNQLLLPIIAFHLACLPWQPDQYGQEQQDQQDRYHPAQEAPAARARAWLGLGVQVRRRPGLDEWKFHARSCFGYTVGRIVASSRWRAMRHVPV
jgi:hypothetical protein